MTDVPAELAELRARISAVESRLDAEASLRAMVDMDLSAISTRLGAQDRLLLSLAQTQSDHTQRLARIEDRAERVEAGVQAILSLLGGKAHDDAPA
jgi:chromosome segregation ATPase